MSPRRRRAWRVDEVGTPVGYARWGVLVVARVFLPSPRGVSRQHLLARDPVRVNLDVAGSERAVAPVDRAHIRPCRDAPPAAHALHAAHRVRPERCLRRCRRKLPAVVDEVARKERDDYKRRGECEERSGDTDEFREGVSARWTRPVQPREVWQAWHGSSDSRWGDLTRLAECSRMTPEIRTWFALQPGS